MGRGGQKRAACGREHHMHGTVSVPSGYVPVARDRLEARGRWEVGCGSGKCKPVGACLPARGGAAKREEEGGTEELGETCITRRFPRFFGRSSTASSESGECSRVCPLPLGRSSTASSESAESGRLGPEPLTCPHAVASCRREVKGMRDDDDDKSTSSSAAIAAQCNGQW